MKKFAVNLRVPWGTMNVEVGAPDSHTAAYLSRSVAVQNLGVDLKNGHISEAQFDRRLSELFREVTGVTVRELTN